MSMKISGTRRLGAIAFACCATVIVISASGCSSNGPQVDARSIAEGEARGKAKREIFLKAGGEYDKMSAEDKKKFLSFFNNETEAKNFWNLMKTPRESTRLDPSSGSQAPGR